MLSQKDVSIVWPLTALGFIITSLAARIFLKEEISSVRWAGICLIVLGAGLVTWSAKQKEREPKNNRRLQQITVLDDRGALKTHSTNQ